MEVKVIRKITIILCLYLMFALGIMQLLTLHVTASNIQLAPIADAYLDFGEPDTNTGASYYLYVYHTTYSSNPTYNFGEKTYLKFDLSSIPESATINSAELKLYSLNNIGETDSIGVHFCSNVNWDELTITWNNAPSFESSAINVRNGIAFGGWYSWDVKSAVQMGVSIKKLTLVLNNDDAPARCTFSSKDTWDVNLKPELIISYAYVPPNVPPTAGFSFSPSNPTINDTIQFMDTSWDTDGTISSLSWNFGDGASSTTKNPQHKYSTNGTYTVSLEVTDNDGATHLTSKTILIENPNSNNLTNDSNNKGTPGFELILVIGAMAFILLWKRKRRE